MALSALHFDNRFVCHLPGDPNESPQQRQVFGACYSKIFPQNVRQPRCITYSSETAQLLDLDKDSCESQLFTEIFSGNDLLPGMFPFAMCYGGHQFGNWAGQLGDGRAINLGEGVNQDGDRWILQLKGAGPTPYSRRGDGLAVLRSSIREFLCSEAMYHLGIPTTRALSLITTGEQVLRDMFYDGRPRLEPGAVVCRVAPSFIRFGNFEILAARKDVKLLKKLIDYTITTDFPELGEPGETSYFKWFATVCEKTAAMIVDWMRVGFVHGVMNTDNMSILGLTIDYGPYGWLEGYDPLWTPNTTDASQKRYAFGNQPHIGMWNLAQLAQSLTPILNDQERLQQILNESYQQRFVTGWQQMIAAKLGLQRFHKDDNLVSELFEILAMTETDMTIFFRQLACIEPGKMKAAMNRIPEELRPAFYQPEKISKNYLARLSRWFINYAKRIKRAPLTNEKRVQLMNRTNPKYILRNWLVYQAIEKAEQGDSSMVKELQTLVKKPYDEQPQYQKYYARRPDWARHTPGSATLS